MHNSHLQKSSLQTSSLLENPSILQEYYLFLKTKLTCDKSLSLIEEEIFTNFYEEYFSRQEADFLLNTKITLYKDRIKPEHLQVTTSNLLDLTGKAPSSILEKYLNFITANNKCDHDTLLNILVYSILKSGMRNLKVTLKYIKNYRRRVFISCEHTIKRNESEVEYYINVLEVALEFIERMEYKDLNITKEDYEKLIGLQ